MSRQANIGSVEGKENINSSVSAGKQFFEWFCSSSDGKGVTLLHPMDVNTFMSREVDVDEWSEEVKEYVWGVKGYVPSDKEVLYLIESQCFRMTSSPPRNLTVLVNGNHSKIYILQNAICFMSIFLTDTFNDDSCEL